MSISTHIFIYEPLSKSIVDLWYENIGCRFFGGPIAFQCFVQIALNTAKMKHVWLQTSIQLGMDLGALNLCVCNHVGKISKRIPRLFQWFPTVVKIRIL